MGKIHRPIKQNFYLNSISLIKMITCIWKTTWRSAMRQKGKQYHWIFIHLSAQDKSSNLFTDILTLQITIRCQNFRYLIIYVVYFTAQTWTQVWSLFFSLKMLLNCVKCISVTVSLVGYGVREFASYSLTILKIILDKHYIDAKLYLEKIEMANDTKQFSA